MPIEPFTAPARQALMRAQKVAQLFGSSDIGVVHIAFALAETDDPVGALLASALDRDAMRERLGAATSLPQEEMTFAPGAKQTIELAFEHARRLRHDFIAPPHLALGMLGSDDSPSLAAGADLVELLRSLDRVANDVP